MHRMITMHARPRQTDRRTEIWTDEQYGNSATIRSTNASRVKNSTRKIVIPEKFILNFLLTALSGDAILCTNFGTSRFNGGFSSSSRNNNLDIFVYHAGR